MYTKPNISVEVHSPTQGFRLHYNYYANAAEFMSACKELSNEVVFKNPLGLPAYLDVNDVNDVELIYKYLEFTGKLESYSIDQWVGLHNQYCTDAGYPDDRIYTLDDDFFNTYFANNPAEVVRATCFGSVNLADKYVKFNGYGNLESISKFRIDEHIDFDEIIEHVFENQHLYNL